MKRKIVVTIAIILAMIMAQFSVFINYAKAETITGSEGDVCWSYDTETHTLIFSGTGEIPSSNRWSQTEGIDRDEIKNITINDGITRIGSYAFGMCTKVTSIEIPNSVSGIFEEAFNGCSSLTNITVDEENRYYSCIEGVLFNKDKRYLRMYPGGKQGPYQVPNGVTTIFHEAFQGCTGLTSIKIPNSVTDIGNNGFKGCTSLTNITVDEENRNYCSIDGVLFNKDKSKLIIYPEGKKGAYQIPNSVTKIGDRAFYRDENVVIYCKSDSTAKQYAIDNNIAYIVDDTVPTISLTQDGNFINIEAADNEGGAGLSSKAYSLDGENWQSSNKFEVVKSGTYTIYVRDKLYNVANKTIDVTISEQSDDKGDSTPESQDNNNKGSSEGQSSNSDDSQAKTNIPNTGAYFPIAIIAIAGVVSFIRYRKYRNNKI